ncbi:semaphorin-4F isoform X2 [Leopardus geoffroyi]|uniref:semaphorin-4F isoform X2 n=1 Tax=Leopardus geoffroyi TaxID=46844 RepID=UPI001E25DE7E|nr:semaphorin-4F isoform X2 [Leopardus geoffroyi]
MLAFARRPRPGSQPPPASPFPLLLLAVLSGPVSGRVPRSVPRTSLPISEADSYLTRFTVPQTYNYSVLLVDPASHTLYVGARDTIFALSLPFSGERPRRIDWMVPEAHRQNCRKKGKKEDVSSFQQVERLESGRGKCPFEPAQRSAAVMAGGVLYAATVKNYLGTEPIISRAVGRAEDWIRTETLPSWLNAPAFVAAVALSPADWGDEDGDDEIYFFFTETSRAFDSYERIKVPRVARVCAGDLGGRKTLQHRWTTFLKADLLCPGPEHGRASSVLQDMAILRPEHGSGTFIFYGIFSSQWEGAAISAVCAFLPQDIRTVLNGPFRELKHDCNRGLPVMDNDVPQPRPGECIANNMKLQQFGSSLSLPDRVLTFIRDHPLMDRPVFPADGHPLLVTTDTAYLRIVAHRVTSLSGKEYDVLYLGTGTFHSQVSCPSSAHMPLSQRGSHTYRCQSPRHRYSCHCVLPLACFLEDGHLHRAVQIGAQLSVLEDLALFPEPQPIESMKLYQNWLLVGSHSEVTQVNTTNCGRLQSCSECILAQDPVCAWSFRLDACVAHAGEHGGLVQDIESADVSSLCPKEPGERPVVFEVPVATAAHVVLPCSPSSAWASCVWHRPSGVTALTPRRDGLEVVVTPGAMGAYACECQEGGAARVVAAYSLVWGSQRGPPSQAHTVGAGLAGFVLGVLAASLTLLLIGRRQQRRRQRELLARDKVGLDLGAPPSGTTSYSQDPPSPSPEDERLPLALAKRSSGFGGFPPPFLLDPCPSPAHIRLTGAPLATCDETSI